MSQFMEAGPYGLGPYILKEGYIEGDRRTDTATLVANPHYWDENSPKVEKITLFMGMSQEEAKQKHCNLKVKSTSLPSCFQMR